jgi:hypothetical protein
MKMKTIERVSSKLKIGAMKNEGKSILSKNFELLGHEGERVRVHIGEDDKLTIETRATQKRLICELDVPEKKWLHEKIGAVDDSGEPIIESKEKPLDITKVTLKEYIEEAEVIKK